jgi:DNA modification methylase
MQELQNWPIDKIIEYVRNPRKNDHAVDRVAAAIHEFGFRVPLLAKSDGSLVDGHLRLKAAKKLGLSDVPVILCDDMSEAQIKAFRISVNKVADYAEWDDELLRLEFDELKEMGFDLDLTGFSLDEIGALQIEEIPPGLTHPDAVPETPPTPLSVAGDVWVLGPHRLIVGDSTIQSDVEVVMGGAMADCLWTDPPYNVNYEGSAGKIKNDHMKDGAFRKFLRDAFTSAFTVMKPGAPSYIAHADTEGLNFRAGFSESGFKISGCLIWRKNSLVLGRSDYQWQHEPILYGWKPGAAHRWYGGRKNTTLLELGGDLVTDNGDGTLTLRLGSESAVISGDGLSLHRVESTVFNVEKPKRSSEHPTMKPTELITRMLRNSTREGDVVLDLFGGSGSTLIACEMLGRFCRMVEFDPRFADVIIKRWQEFTGKQATLEATGETFEEKSKK